MPGPSTSREAILVATRQAIIERGPGKLTLSAVAAAAGVSRPTLYRWFPTKDDLLVAFVDYEEQQFDAGLRSVVGAYRSPARKLDAALHYLVTYLDDVMSADPIGADPRVALESLARSLPVQVESLVRLLGDAFQQVPAVRSRRLSREQAAELFLRMAYSHFLVPHADPEALLANMRTFAGMPRGATMRATG